MIDHETLERRLRDVADPSVWDGVSPDAWQQNELRVAVDRARRAGRRLRVVATAAAAMLVVGGGFYAASQLTGSSVAPANGGSQDQDPFEPKNLVGKKVVVERYQVDGATVVHSAFLTRAGGKGLSFCDEYKGPDTATSSSGSGGCTASSRDASDPRGNAIAFLTGTDGSDGSNQTSISGAVASRVAALKAWVGDSASPRTIRLHALGVDGLQAFGITILGPHAPVVRIVAYNENGGVIQSHDSSDTARKSSCKNAKTVVHNGALPNGTSFAFTNSSVRVSVKPGSTECLPLNSLAYVPLGARTVLVLVPPEAEHVTVQGPDGDRAAPLVTFDATPWRFAVVTPAAGVPFERYRVVLTDATGQPGGTVSVSHRLFTSP